MLQVAGKKGAFACWRYSSGQLDIGGGRRSLVQPRVSPESWLVSAPVSHGLDNTAHRLRCDKVRLCKSGCI